MKVYGSRVSYYTGKIETYLRYKGIEYTREKMPYNDPDRIKKHVGAIQHPIIERSDGRWMSDTSPMILHFETEQPDYPVLPSDPVMRFFALLIEDYADEYLWRSAMHYRWSYPLSQKLLADILTEELRGHSIPAPDFIKKRMVTRRQRHFFVKRDGVNSATRRHVEQGYSRALAHMSAMLKDRPFVLGSVPSIADFGLMGPMFRHFSQDPAPAEIMRTDAPAVYEWVARMWNAHANRSSTKDAAAGFLDHMPADSAPCLQEICETHLHQLGANAAAFAANASHFDMTLQGCRYVKMPVSRYRVWCLEKLRSAFAELDDAQKRAVQALLPYDNSTLLWSQQNTAVSGYDTGNRLPFGQAINVYGDGTP